MLLKLANMLVYQLATLQSEALAEKTSQMFEQSLGFLRRSIIPSHLRASNSIKGKLEHKKDAFRIKSKHVDRMPSPCRRASVSIEPGLPPLVNKSGPEDMQDSRRKPGHTRLSAATRLRNRESSLTNCIIPLSS
jgi:hypothetical protein